MTLLEKNFLRINRGYRLSSLAGGFDVFMTFEFRGKRSQNSQQAQLQHAYFNGRRRLTRQLKFRCEPEAGAWAFSKGLNLPRVFRLRQRILIAIDCYHRAAALVHQKYLLASHAQIDIRPTRKEARLFERSDRKVVLHLLWRKRCLGIFVPCRRIQSIELAVTSR